MFLLLSELQVFLNNQDNYEIILKWNKTGKLKKPRELYPPIPQITQNPAKQSNASLQDHWTITGLWMVQPGRTPCTEECQAVLSHLSNSKPKPTDCCQHTCTGVTLSSPGLGRAELWACFWGRQASPALHSQSYRLTVLLATHSTNLISPFFIHKVSVCMSVHTPMYFCAHTPPLRSKDYSPEAISPLRNSF